MNTIWITLAAVALFALLFGLEHLFPLRTGTRSLMWRLMVNVAISALTFLAAATLVQPATQWALHWSNAKPFGLVHLFTLPVWLELVVSVLLMDLAFYYWHLANHRIPLLWRFHNVHHTDPELDVSTAFRFHFGEIALSSVFNVIQISLIGISPWAFVVYQLVFQSEVLFHHSNLRLPIAFERFLSKVLVTPRMHGIHHSQVHRENNSNFGTVFPWWDRLHRTLGLNIPQSKVVVGIPAYSLPGDNTVPNALLMPFRKQRDYWRAPDGTIVERDKSSSESNPARLVE
ncbi:MAG: sterol desaturase family protein [Verrucomicrobiota bacterium]|nr:sterol desaturase family protein [Verrucomicrobiota bacterium]